MPTKIVQLALCSSCSLLVLLGCLQLLPAVAVADFLCPDNIEWWWLTIHKVTIAATEYSRITVQLYIGELMFIIDNGTRIGHIQTDKELGGLINCLKAGERTMEFDELPPRRVIADSSIRIVKTEWPRQITEINHPLQLGRHLNSGGGMEYELSLSLGGIC
ncbi:hypothetical protein BOX15_Mlig015125g1 [Macrostomum lignano]|uniref:Uncharacterized protein n=1 Tax=Macrostomum lignano TaxID=282301 RepID=A0A267E2L7_9PLAT|nr:hypothetical protein BOX15_Mlig015125g2 [Macrostomum lignano]PAA65520.1 hypothetical protein BOX15_Mlig015125g1 [Macrostomum lignano]